MSYPPGISEISGSISGVQGIGEQDSGPQGADGVSFGDLLSDKINQTVELQEQADALSRQYAAGEIDDLTQVTQAVTRADIAWTMTMEVRDRAVEAYQQISRMPI